VKIAILNDTEAGASTTGGLHFGCQLVMGSLRTLLTDNGHKVVQSVPSSWGTYTLNPEADLVIVNGEGSLHHNRRRELLAVAAQAPAILINTVWQDNDPQGLESFRHVACRESFSAKQAGEVCPVSVMPDLLFASPTVERFASRFVDADSDLLLTDSVMNQGGGIGCSAIQSAEAYLTMLQRHQRVATGRFHTTAACAALGIPFSCYPSNTHKLEGMLHDMGLPHLFFKTHKEAVENCPLGTSPEATAYAESAKQQIESFFTNLERFV
jgi:hypothetical protein